MAASIPAAQSPFSITRRPYMAGPPFDTLDVGTSDVNRNNVYCSMNGTDTIYLRITEAAPADQRQHIQWMFLIRDVVDGEGKRPSSAALEAGSHHVAVKAQKHDVTV